MTGRIEGIGAGLGVRASGRRPGNGRGAELDELFAKAAFGYELRVFYEDTDGTGVVYHANYLRYFERARTEWLRALGFNQIELAAAHAIVFTVAHAQITFRAPALLDDVLIVEVAVAAQRRVSIEFVQRIRLLERAGATLSAGDGLGPLLCQARVDVACIGRDSKRPCRIPAVIYEELVRVG